VLAVSALLTAGAVPASATDDYPWRSASGNSADSWASPSGSASAGRPSSSRSAGSPLDNRQDRWGDAANWDNAARRLGHGIGSEPVVGAVAHWNPGERGAWYADESSTANGLLHAGSAGHVGYVTGVHADGSAVVQQYNADGNRSWSIVRCAPRATCTWEFPRRCDRRASGSADSGHGARTTTAAVRDRLHRRGQRMR
jgi:surface antigen